MVKPDRNISVVFSPSGPLPLPKVLDSKSLKFFWKQHKELGGAIGCYVFGIRAAKGIRPWYVGKAKKQSFSKETNTSDKREKFKLVMAGQKKGNPVLFLLARKTLKNKFSKIGTSHRDIDHVEDILIGKALSRNPILINVSRTKHLKTISVPGLLNESPGKRTSAASAFAKLVGG